MYIRAKPRKTLRDVADMQRVELGYPHHGVGIFSSMQAFARTYVH